MPIESMEPSAAHQAMSGDDSCAFLDVRTCDEYDQGHPEGAVNVPWALVDATGQMAPNPDFVPTVQKTFPAEQRLFLSCQAGMRSLRACQDLESAGYKDLVNVDGGFGGRRDPMGQLVTTGWVDSDLPVQHDKSTYGQVSR